MGMMERESVLAVLKFIDEIGIEHAKWRVIKSLQAYIVDLDRMACLEAEKKQWEKLAMDAYNCQVQQRPLVLPAGTKVTYGAYEDPV